MCVCVRARVCVCVHSACVCGVCVVFVLVYTRVCVCVCVSYVCWSVHVCVRVCVHTHTCHTSRWPCATARRSSKLISGKCCVSGRTASSNETGGTVSSMARCSRLRHTWSMPTVPCAAPVSAASVTCASAFGAGEEASWPFCMLAPHPMMGSLYP